MCVAVGSRSGVMYRLFSWNPEESRYNSKDTARKCKWTQDVDVVDPALVKQSAGYDQLSSQNSIQKSRVTFSKSVQCSGGEEYCNVFKKSSVHSDASFQFSPASDK
jgi:hypothetical protein